jgi:hypothetical protein
MCCRHKNRGVKAKQLDERIGNTKVRVGRTRTDECLLYSAGRRYQGIANTIVQLIRWSTSGVMAASQPIGPDERHFKERAWP